MTLLQLNYFRALAKNLHYTKTAEEIHISQPSLSYAITELEKELGGPLFLKHNKQIHLTQSGETLLRYVEQALDTLEDGIQMFRLLNENTNHTVTLGYFYSISSPMIPQIIKDFYSDKAHTHVHFSFLQDQNDGLARMLRDGSANLSFLLDPDPAFESVPIMHQPLYLAVPKGHRLANREFVRFPDFADEDMIALKRNSSLRIFLEDYFKQQGKIPHVIFEVQECNATHQFIALNFGVAIIPKTPAMDYSAFSIVPIDDPAFCRTVYLCRAKDKCFSPASQLIWNFIIDRFKVDV